MADLGDLSAYLTPEAGTAQTQRQPAQPKPQNKFGGVDHGDLSHLIGPPESAGSFLNRNVGYLKEAGHAAYEHPGETVLGFLPYAGLVAPQAYEGYKSGGLKGAGEGIWQGTKEAALPLGASLAAGAGATMLGGPLVGIPAGMATYSAVQNLERPYFHPEQGPVDPAEVAANAEIGGVLGGLMGAGFHGGEEKVPLEKLAPGGGEPPPPPPGAPPSPPGAPPPAGPTPQFTGEGLKAQGPRGGPGQPPVDANTPPENSVLDRPAIKLEDGSVIPGQHGQTHNEIKGDLEAHLKLIFTPASVDKMLARVEHGFITNDGKFVNRPQARAEIAAETGAAVGKGSPTSEQLGAEQGKLPPGQGEPKQPADMKDRIAAAPVAAVPPPDTLQLPTPPTSTPPPAPDKTGGAFSGQRIVDAKSRSTGERIREVLPFDQASARARELAAKGYDVTNRAASATETTKAAPPLASVPAPTADPITTDTPAPPPGAEVRAPLPDMFQEKGLPPNIQKWFDLAHAKEQAGDLTGAARYLEMAKTLQSTARSKALQEYYRQGLGEKEEVPPPAPKPRGRKPKPPVSPAGEKPAPVETPSAPKPSAADKVREQVYREKFRKNLETQNNPERGSLDYISKELELQNKKAAKEARDRSDPIDYGQNDKTQAEIDEKAESLLERQSQPAEKSYGIPWKLWDRIHGMANGTMDEEMAGRVAFAEYNKGPYEVLSSQGIRDIINQGIHPLEGKQTFDGGKFLQEWDRAAGHNPDAPLGKVNEAKATSYTPETGQVEAATKPPVVEKVPPKGANASKLAEFVKGKPRGILALPEPLVHAAEEVRDASTSLDAFTRRSFGGSNSAEAQVVKGIYRAGMGERGANEFKVGQILDTVADGMRSLTKAEQLDAMEREDKGIKQPTPELQAYHKVHEIIYNDLKKQTAETAKYTGIPEEDIVPLFKEHYMRRAFRKTPDDRTVLSISEPRKNLLGQRGYTKERTQDSLYDAVKAARERGMELVTNDPIEMEKHHYGEMQKYLIGLKMFKDQQDLGLREWVKEKYRDETGKWVKGDMPKPGWVKEPTEVSRSYGPLNPKGEKQPGSWYVPEGVARVTRNHLSVSLWNQPWYKVLRSGTNLAVEWKLGLSVYHGLGTAMNAFQSDLSMGVRYMLEGHPLEAMPKLARAATVVGPVVRHFREGGKMLREFEGSSLRDQNLPPHLRQYFDAGGRIVGSKFDTDVIVDRMVDSFKASLHTPGIGGKALAVAKLPFAAMEYLARPIFKKLVPQVKMSVFKDMMAHNARGLDPEADKAEYQAIAGRALNDVDDRFGQIHYDNLFWYKPMQNMIHLLMQAPGWFLGNWRAFGGGAMDLLGAMKGKGLSDRAAFALSYPLGVAMTSMLTQYLLTGTLPKLVTNAESNFTNFWMSWRNFMHPEDGRKRDDGSPERIQLPSYMRELENVSEILPPELGGTPGGLSNYMQGKESPLVAMSLLALTNADWKNQQVVNPHDPWSKIASDAFKAGGEQLGIPISIQNVMRGRAAAQGSGEEKAPNWQALLGISVPKAKWQGTPFRNALYADADRKKPKGPFTQEEAQKMQLNAQVRGMFRRGAKVEQVKPYLQKMYQAGMFNPHLSLSSQVEKLVKEGTDDPLQSATRHADLDTILENYHLATPEEQKEVNKILGARLAGKGKPPSVKNKPILQHIMHEWMSYEATHPEDAEKLKSEAASD
jgi:hypothetical protein